MLTTVLSPLPSVSWLWKLRSWEVIVGPAGSEAHPCFSQALSSAACEYGWNNEYHFPRAKNSFILMTQLAQRVCRFVGCTGRPSVGVANAGDWQTWNRCNFSCVLRGSERWLLHCNNIPRPVRAHNFAHIAVHHHAAYAAYNNNNTRHYRCFIYIGEFPCCNFFGCKFSPCFTFVVLLFPPCKALTKVTLIAKIVYIYGTGHYRKRIYKFSNCIS